MKTNDAINLTTKAGKYRSYRLYNWPRL